MQTHHTPGPWIYKIRPDGSAYMSRGNPKTGPHHQSDVYGSVDDIRLMTAAKELLETLCSTASMLQSACLVITDKEARQMALETVAEARAAIAKATRT